MDEAMKFQASSVMPGGTLGIDVRIWFSVPERLWEERVGWSVECGVRGRAPPHCSEAGILPSASALALL
jgi:hypothetical protein